MTPMLIGLHQVITFATEPFRGNPACVLTPDTPLSDRSATSLVDELKADVLAVLNPIDGAEKIELRFFTSQGAHPGAGHAALAAAFVALDGHPEDGASVTFRLADGSERIAAREDGRIAFTWPLMPGTPVDSADALKAALGAKPVDCLVAPFGYVAVYDDMNTVANLSPDLAAVERLDRGALIATAPGDDSDIVLRVFAPKLGLPEDPVCGTAHRILTPYWAERLGKPDLHSRQLSQRGGDLWCRLGEDRVVIAGNACVFLAGFLELPER
jgi:PhzF family phenazine biosynthesis protein